MKTEGKRGLAEPPLFRITSSPIFFITTQIPLKIGHPFKACADDFYAI
jgi:hypothetical protein